MTDQDILTILRDRHANVTGVDPRIATPIVGPTIFSQAADEIERLRKRLLAEENYSDIRRIEAEQMKKQRDEVRVLYCRDLARYSEYDLPEDIAERMKWDCFKDEVEK